MGDARPAPRPRRLDARRRRAASVAVSDDCRKGELVALEDVRFPKVPSFPFATYMPRVWRMDYGPDYAATRV